ncbi:MAG TPA: hypothetical protein VFO80_11790 [Sphingomonas sp.]|nr:hypothetical protein [Sphingomonas sp.]
MPAIPVDTRHAALPLTPSEYVALRRRAAGFTVENLARALVTVGVHGRRHKPTDTQLAIMRRRAIDQVRLMERPGSVIVSHDALRLIQSVMPFDPAIYRQLAEAPAHRHARICRGCGCSDHDPCISEVDRVESICRLLSPHLCTHCVDRGLAEIGKAA